MSQLRDFNVICVFLKAGELLYLRAYKLAQEKFASGVTEEEPVIRHGNNSPGSKEYVNHVENVKIVGHGVLCLIKYLCQNGVLQANQVEIIPKLGTQCFM